MLKKILLICMAALCCCLQRGALAAEPLKVSIVEGQATAEVSCEDEFTVTASGTGETVTMPKGKYFLHLQDGGLKLDENSRGNLGSRIIIRAAEGKAQPQINKREYYGDYAVYVKDNNISVINRVDPELYLACVLPAKTMPVWPDEVIKAQAVAARSYLLYMMGAAGGGYDISANDAELPYYGRGERYEKEAVTRLIKATAGQYLAYGGRPARAVTTSSSGGRTESALNAWGEEIAYLQSVVDYDSDSPDYRWENRIAPFIIRNLLEQRGFRVGQLQSVRLSPLDEPGVDRTSTGRVRYIIFSGSEGMARVGGRELADMLGLNSCLFDVETGIPVPDKLDVPIENGYGYQIGSKEIDIKVSENDAPVWKNVARSYHLISGSKEERIVFKGRGKGHGVGLSAWEARGMANASAKNTYRAILAHYYPGTVLMKK